MNIFLCHSSSDKPLVRQLYKRLVDNQFAVWLDEENILPGQDWEAEITKAVRNADVVIVCLSKDSINKSGYVQKEIRFALSFAEEKPDGVIFIIPARLEECNVPDKLRKWQWVDMFNPDGYKKLLLALQANLSQQDKAIEYSKETGARIQSGLARTTSSYSHSKSSILDGSPQQQLTITLRTTGDKERDKRRIKTIYGTVISFHGKDRFSFRIFESGTGILIDFPLDTTRVCDELLHRLKILLGSDHDLHTEPIFTN